MKDCVEIIRRPSSRLQGKMTRIFLANIGGILQEVFSTMRKMPEAHSPYSPAFRAVILIFGSVSIYVLVDRYRGTFASFHWKCEIFASVNRLFLKVDRGRSLQKCDWYYRSEIRMEKYNMSSRIALRNHNR